MKLRSASYFGDESIRTFSRAPHEPNFVLLPTSAKSLNRPPPGLLPFIEVRRVRRTHARVLVCCLVQRRGDWIIWIHERLATLVCDEVKTMPTGICLLRHGPIDRLLNHACWISTGPVGIGTALIDLLEQPCKAASGSSVHESGTGYPKYGPIAMASIP